MGFLRKNLEGTHIGQIKDAYPSVTADITRLQKEVMLFWGPGQHLPCLVSLFNSAAGLATSTCSTPAGVGGVSCWHVHIIFQIFDR